MPFFARWEFWLYASAWLPFTLALAFYGLRSPWRGSRVGQGLFTLYAALTAVLTLALAAYSGAIPDAFRDVLRVLTIGGVAAAGWVQLANILSLQRQARCREDATSTS